MPLDPEVIREHMHSYISHGNEIVKRSATQEFGLLAIPVPSEGDIKLLTERIKASEWNMQNIQDILFSVALDFKHDQVWDLAGVITERKQRDNAERMTAFMMLAHPRLGELNALSILDPDTLHSMVEKSLV